MCTIHTPVGHLLHIGTVLGVGATPVNKTNKFLPLRHLHPGQEAHSKDSSQPQGNHPTVGLAPNPELRARRWSPELRVYNLHPQIQKPEPKTPRIRPIPPSPELRAWSSESRTSSKNSESGAQNLDLRIQISEPRAQNRGPDYGLLNPQSRAWSS